MSANITDLKETAEDLANVLEFYKKTGHVEPVAELAAMLARIEDKIEQFEEADGLIDAAEELLENHATQRPEADPDFETPY